MQVLLLLLLLLLLQHTVVQKIGIRAEAPLTMKGHLKDI
jgi:hypothetical protein